MNHIYDFADTMNVGLDTWQTHPKEYLRARYEFTNKDDPNEYCKLINYQGIWKPGEINFYRVWDRHPCKIHSSIAEQSNHHYIGDSQVCFNPIKYYKLNSTDQKFWIEFYSTTHYNIPIKVPKNGSFVIKMQFLPYNKMLYIYNY